MNPPVQAEQQADEGDEEDETVPIPLKLPRVSRSAEFQGPGILQVEYGYDGNFHSEDLRSDQSGSLDLNFPVTEWLLLEFSMDTILAQTDPLGSSARGVGDIRMGFQTTALEDKKFRPSIAFAYLAKLPSASQATGLGTGRTDHQITSLVSKKIGDLEIDCSLGLLINGRERQSGHVKGGQFAVGFSYDLGIGIGIQGEISSQNTDSDQPRGTYALGALTYQLGRKITFGIGSRFGLDSVAPAFGAFAGATISVANLYKD